MGSCFHHAGLCPRRNRGQVAGLTFDFGASLGYIWNRGEATLLQGLGSFVSEVRDINDRGVVVGTSNVEPFRLHAVIWEGGQIMDLGVLPGFFDSRGVALNNRGQVIGQMIADSVQGFLWEDGEMTLLPILPGYQTSGPFSINDAGQIVGGSESSTAAVPTLWIDELMPIDLNSLICADDPLLPRVMLEFARRINKRGQIVATGRDTELPNQVRSFLLTPTH
jgi:probable HAF family extracellular repeat protein